MNATEPMRIADRVAADRIAADRIAVDWIAVDWGTSNLRVWAMAAGGAVLAQGASAAGMAGLTRAGFEPALLALIAGWLAPGRVTEVVACGMVGSRQGWIEAEYAAAPCPPLGAPFASPAVRDPRIAVRVLPGLRQAAPADVMRGEETQIAGLLAHRPRFDGVACLPGTHSKWAHVSAGEVVSFTSFLTGELFGLLAGESVLRHSVGAEGWSEADFAESVEEALAAPGLVAARLFGLRAEALLNGLSPERARARLSGLLIGMELGGARPHWLGREVVLIGAGRVTGPYRAALALGGLEARVLDATDMTLAGLTAAHAQISTKRAAT